MNAREIKQFLINNQQFWYEGLTFSKVREMSQEQLNKVYNNVISIRDSYNAIKDYTRIELPTFKINGHTLNEYELRQLMVDIKLGRFQGGYEVQDCKGNYAILHSNGTISGELYGLDIITNLTINLLRE